MARKKVELEEDERGQRHRTMMKKREQTKAEKWPTIPIFLVWARQERKTAMHEALENVDLRAVDLDLELAEIHKKQTEHEAELLKNGVTKVWIEEREANHSYGQRDLRLAMRLLPPDGENDWIGRQRPTKR